VKLRTVRGRALGVFLERPAPRQSSQAERPEQFRGSRMSQYVLGKTYPEMGGAMMFICGNHPKMPFFHSDVESATKFGSPEDALVFRYNMDHQLGGTEKYHIHELVPGGGVRDLEA
jgi:hypothetical protein